MPEPVRLVASLEGPAAPVPVGSAAPGQFRSARPSESGQKTLWAQRKMTTFRGFGQRARRVAYSGQRPRALQSGQNPAARQQRLRQDLMKLPSAGGPP